jgi:hypothetical protein
MEENAMAICRRCNGRRFVYCGFEVTFFRRALRAIWGRLCPDCNGLGRVEGPAKEDEVDTLYLDLGGEG